MLEIKESKFMSENSRVLDFYCEFQLEVPAVKINTNKEPVILVNSNSTFQEQYQAINILESRSNVPEIKGNLKSHIKELYAYILECELKHREMNRMFELAKLKMDIKAGKTKDAMAYINTLKTETVYTGTI